MATKSMQRSLDLIKENGWLYDITEQPYNRYTKKRKDLFNFIDILCLYRGRTIAIQACGSDFQPHKRKIEGNVYVRPWLKAGNELQVWAWRKIKRKRGGKAMYWAPRIFNVYVIKKELYWKERK